MPGDRRAFQEGHDQPPAPYTNATDSTRGHHPHPAGGTNDHDHPHRHHQL